MKVAFVEPHLKLFGGIRRILELSNRLTDRGVDVSIYHPEGTPCEWMECRARIRASRELAEATHDVLIYNDPNPDDFDLVRRANARLRVFYVLELYETSLLSGFHPMIYRPRNQRTLYMKRSIRAGYLLLVNATWMGDFLRERMGLDSTLLFGGVNRDMFHPRDRLPNTTFRVLCSGDPRPRKGTEMIRKAVEAARHEHPGLELDTYHGRGIPQDRMAQVYTASDLFIEASSQAGWNNPAAEAMACRVPLICTDIGGVRDFAIHEETALLVPPHDNGALTAAILRMAGDPGLRERLSARGLERIHQFDWDRSADRLIEILERSLVATETPMFNPSYVGPRRDILRLVPEDAKNVLDVGCSVGTLGQALRERGAVVTGIEMDEQMGAQARDRLDRVHIASVEDPALFEALADQRYDCIIFADLLEHLVDPWAALDRFVERLAPGGVVVASLPNIRHYTTIRTLLFQGYWPYRDRGIHDRTHMRFFTLRNIRELFASSGLSIRKVDRNYRIIERPHRLNRLAPALALPGLRELIAFQYLVQAGRDES